MRRSQYATSNTNLEGEVGCKVLQFIIHNEDQEDAWLQNPLVQIHSNFFNSDELGQNFVSDHNLLEQGLLSAFATCVYHDGS